MKGEFVPVWKEMWDEVWIPLNAHESAPKDLFCELYRELAKALAHAPSVEHLADTIEDIDRSFNMFKSTDSREFAGERRLVEFLESVYPILEDFGGDDYANAYFLALEQFINKYSLRYELRRPCVLCPTLPGLFTSLINDLRGHTARDPHLHTLMTEFETAVRDLRMETTDGRIKICIQKQVNLIEAIARQCPGVTRNTLGAMCDQLASWPHAKLKEAMQSVYSFASDYPGIRHGGTPANAIRNIDMRDLLALSILLAGFTPYLNHQINADTIYRGA